MNDQKRNHEQPGDDSDGESDFTPEEEAVAEEEAMAFVYGMGVGMGEMYVDPLSTPEGMAIFMAKKEELLLQMRKQRLGWK